MPVIVQALSGAMVAAPPSTGKFHDVSERASLKLCIASVIALVATGSSVAMRSLCPASWTTTSGLSATSAKCDINVCRPKSFPLLQLGVEEGVVVRLLQQMSSCARRGC